MEKSELFFMARNWAVLPLKQ